MVHPGEQRLLRKARNFELLTDTKARDVVGHGVTYSWRVFKRSAGIDGDPSMTESRELVLIHHDKRLKLSGVVAKRQSTATSALVFSRE